MNTKGVLWAVLAASQVDYDEYCRTSALYVWKPDGWTLERCQFISKMLDVYQAQKAHIQIIQLEGWENMWSAGEILEIYRRLEL